MLSDEQFEKMLERISINQQDRATLIRIEEGIKNHLDNYNKDRIEIGKQIVLVDQKASASHKRMDRLIGIGGWTVFLTVSGLVVSVLFSMWNINEKRFDDLVSNRDAGAYTAPAKRG